MGDFFCPQVPDHAVLFGGVKQGPHRIPSFQGVAHEPAVASASRISASFCSFSPRTFSTHVQGARPNQN
jgi:hypothetical protein